MAFYVEYATFDAGYRDLNEIEVVQEEKLLADPDNYLLERGWGFYRACHYLREIFDEGTALLRPGTMSTAFRAPR